MKKIKVLENLLEVEKGGMEVRQRKISVTVGPAPSLAPIPTLSPNPTHTPALNTPGPGEEEEGSQWQVAGGRRRAPGNRRLSGSRTTVPAPGSPDTAAPAPASPESGTPAAAAPGPGTSAVDDGWRDFFLLLLCLYSLNISHEYSFYRSITSLSWCTSDCRTG